MQYRIVLLFLFVQFWRYQNIGQMKEGNGFSESFIVGVIAVVFLVIGYQTALFIHRAAVMKIAAGRDEPDTVYLYRQSDSESYHEGSAGEYSADVVTERRSGSHSPRAETVRQSLPRKKIESFRFDPNTVSVEDLCRLGFTPKQAQSIDNYRKKGGRFRRKADFAKSFVVSDSVYKRLEQYIDIPLTDLNLADSAAFDALPGIGGWFAAKMIEHRKALGGYSYKEQLMDIYRFDQEKFDALNGNLSVGAKYANLSSRIHTDYDAFLNGMADEQGSYVDRYRYTEDIYALYAKYGFSNTDKNVLNQDAMLNDISIAIQVTN